MSHFQILRILLFITKTAFQFPTGGPFQWFITQLFLIQLSLSKSAIWNTYFVNVSICIYKFSIFRYGKNRIAKAQTVSIFGVPVQT